MWRYVLGVAFFGGIAAWLAVRGLHADAAQRAPYLVGTVLLVPAIAWNVSRFLVHGGVDFGERLRGHLKKEWNGNYYEYATIHLRALEHGDALVFLEDDILNVIARPESMTLKLFGPSERVTVDDKNTRALTQAGCRRLLMKCTHQHAKGLLLYLEREAFFPYAGRREGRGA